MSTIVRAESTPEPSSAPDCTVPVARPWAVPAKRFVALLDGSRDVEDPKLAGVNRAAGRERDRRPALVEDRVSRRVDEAAARRCAELPVARVASAVRRADREETWTADREVQRLARRLDRGLADVCDLAGDLDAAVDRAGGLAATTGEEHRPERALLELVGLVPGRRGVGEIVGELVLARLLDEHPRGGNGQTDVHRHSRRRRPGILEAFVRRPR